jgi:hypothetical protein
MRQIRSDDPKQKLAVSGCSQDYKLELVGDSDRGGTLLEVFNGVGGGFVYNTMYDRYQNFCFHCRVEVTTGRTG